MKSIDEISKIVLKNLKINNKEANPKEYTEEFCKVISDFNLQNPQCTIFINALLELSQEELDSKDENSLKSIYDIVEVLLKRPSNMKLSNATSDVNNVILNMDNQFKEAITKHTHAYNNIDNIKQTIQDISKNEEIDVIKNRLIDVSTSFKSEILELNKQLNSGKDEISLLMDNITQLQKEFNRYKQESKVDYLTSLLTRKAYEQEIEKFEDLYRRDNANYAIIFFDLDDFKKVNDTYGHDCGDVVLKTFAEVLKKLTRKIDIVARYGGEEFIVAVKYKNNKELINYLQRVKNIVNINKFKYKDFKLEISFSAGVDIRSLNKNYENTVKNADKLLYEAKNTGKNKIVTSFDIVI